MIAHGRYMVWWFKETATGFGINAKVQALTTNGVSIIHGVLADPSIPRRTTKKVAGWQEFANHLRPWTSIIFFPSHGVFLVTNRRLRSAIGQFAVSLTIRCLLAVSHGLHSCTAGHWATGLKIFCLDLLLWFQRQTQGTWRNRWTSHPSTPDGSRKAWLGFHMVSQNEKTCNFWDIIVSLHCFPLGFKFFFSTGTHQNVGNKSK